MLDAGELHHALRHLRLLPQAAGHRGLDSQPGQLGKQEGVSKIVFLLSAFSVNYLGKAFFLLTSNNMWAFFSSYV
jgi:hypothetical protein